MSNIAATKILAAAEAAGAELPKDASGRQAVQRAVRSTAFWWMIRSLTVDGDRHNTAALKLGHVTTASGAPVWLIRGGYTAAPSQAGSCFSGLVHRGGVRHVLNLYDGAMMTSDLDAAEAQVVHEAAGTYVHSRNGWRSAMRKPWKAWQKAKDPASKKAAKSAYERARAGAATTVAALIRKHILRPNGRAPIGNVMVHCGGGMHRTGMVVGVLDRCLNKAPMSKITRDYKWHVAWQSDAQPGGFEAQNLDFIAHFPCATLRHKPRRVSPL